MRTFSLFSGIGGFDLAAKQCGHEIVGACEIDDAAGSIYAGHFPDVPVWRDTTRLDAESVPDHDLLCAGFPCQPFSISGDRLGLEDIRGTMFFEIARIAKQKRPRLLLLENVLGLLSHQSGYTFAIFLAALDAVGYDAEWQVLDSKYYTPQTRERVFIIGHSRANPTPEVFPLGTIYGPTDKATPDTHTGALTSNYQKLPNHASFIAVPVHTTQNSGRNGRMFADQGDPAYTLTTWADQGVYDGHEIRRLTPLECERLQGFPDGWSARGHDGQLISDAQRYRGLGNAVTVPVVKYIMEAMA